MSQLVLVAPNLWRLVYSFPVLPGFCLPGTMTVMRAADGGLILHSPTAISDELRSELATLGPVQGIVAPNLMHYKWLAPTAALYPSARVWAPRALAAKVPSAPPYTALDDAGHELVPGVQLFPVAGIPKLSEFALLHNPSASLLLTDLVFNVGPDSKKGWLTPWVLKLAGTDNGLASSKLIKSMVADPGALRASLDSLLAADFERFSPAHGDVVQEDARARLRAATERLAPSA